MPKEESNLTTEEAKSLFEKERRQRTTACQKSVQAVLDEHRCMLDVPMIVTERGSRSQATIIAND